jgi:hypothetical protein
VELEDIILSEIHHPNLLMWNPKNFILETSGYQRPGRVEEGMLVKG